MQDLIKRSFVIRERATRLHVELSDRFSIRTQQSPLDGLNMASNQALLQIEILSYYYNIWSRLPQDCPVKGEQMQAENGERVMAVGKSTFVQLMSIFEFSAKQALEVHPGKLHIQRGRIYLGNIVRASVAAGITSAEDEHAWKGVIELRNTLVHNNGIAERTEKFHVPGVGDISFEAGKMTAGELLFFPNLQLWITEAFGRWCDAYLSKPTQA